MAKSETPLLAFIRAMGSKEMKTIFASECGAKLEYLYQLAAQAEPNPSLRLATAIRAASVRWAKTVKLDPLTFEDLLTGAVDVPDVPVPPPQAPVISTKPRVARKKAA